MAGLSSTLRGSKSVQKTLKDIRAMFTTDTDKVNQIIGIEAVRGIQRNIREQHGPNGEAWPGPPVMRPGGRRLRDTSRLYNSITFRAPLGAKGVRIGTYVKYSALQHFGGTIRPRRAKMLAIPASRQIARQYSGNFRRDFPDAFVIQSKRGNPILVRRQDGGRRRSGSGLQLLAFLRESVNIPATPYFGIGRSTWAQIIKRIEAQVAAVAKRGEKEGAGGGDPHAFFGGAK